MHRTLEVFCDISDNPNLLLHCDQSESDIPWLNQFKMAGSVPLPVDFAGGEAVILFDTVAAGESLTDAVRAYQEMLLDDPQS